MSELQVSLFIFLIRHYLQILNLKTTQNPVVLIFFYITMSQNL